jgi:excisionase family DNA binding protein
MKDRDAAAPSRLMTTRELAAYLKIDLDTLYKLLRKGQIPFFKVGGDYRFNRDEIDKWMNDLERAGAKK